MQADITLKPPAPIPSPWGETPLDRALLAVDTTKFLIKWVVIHRGGGALLRPVQSALHSLGA